LTNDELSEEATINISTKLQLKVFVSPLIGVKLQAETPTTIVPLSPDKIEFQNGTADLFFGVFHIKWSDMPTPRTYALRICDSIKGDGEYVGSLLLCKYPRKSSIPLGDH
jgi:hypothetical protein